MIKYRLPTGRGSLLGKFKLWSRGYVIKKNFLTDFECQKIREYTMSLNWARGATGLPLGSYCTHQDNLFFGFDECLFNKQVVASRELLFKDLGVELADVGARSLLLRMHSPIWHIDMQTFNNDHALIARDRRFRVFKCGVYLQGESMTGGGTLELKQPFLGGGLKNVIFTGKMKEADHKILRGIILILGILSDCIQIKTKKLKINKGDLIIFDGSLKHRASQNYEKINVQIDSETGHYTDYSDLEGKIMLQWEFVVQNEFGMKYIDHASSKHSAI